VKNFTKKDLVFDLVKKIPLGKVTSYRKIAFSANLGSPRIVGSILHQNNNPQIIPCHRVVHSDGSLAKTFAFGGEKGQRKKLEAEGVFFEGRKVKRAFLI
jgi:O-6-methylguanine DNA methyltransferase